MHMSTVLCTYVLFKRIDEEKAGLPHGYATRLYTVCISLPLVALGAERQTLASTVNGPRSREIREVCFVQGCSNHHRVN
jgi:hypothetical protein